MRLFLALLTFAKLTIANQSPDEQGFYNVSFIFPVSLCGFPCEEDAISWHVKLISKKLALLDIYLSNLITPQQNIKPSSVFSQDWYEFSGTAITNNPQKKEDLTINLPVITFPLPENLKKACFKDSPTKAPKWDSWDFFTPEAPSCQLFLSSSETYSVDIHLTPANKNHIFIKKQFGRYLNKKKPLHLSDDIKIYFLTTSDLHSSIPSDRFLLEHQNALKTLLNLFPPKEGNLKESLKHELSWKSPTTLLNKKTNLSFQVFFGDFFPEKDAIKTTQFITSARKHSDIFIFNGHSELGHSPLNDILSSTKNISPSTMVFNSCSSFGYIYQHLKTFLKNGSFEVLLNLSEPGIKGSGNIACSFLELILDSGQTNHIPQLSQRPVILSTVDTSTAETINIGYKP